MADVHEGSQPRLGQVGVNHDDDAVEGIVLLQRGRAVASRAASARTRKWAQLNGGLLPRGMKLVTLYNRSDLINVTTSTVRDIVIVGLALVTLVLIIFLGDIPISLIAALTIPCSLLFAFSLDGVVWPLRESDIHRGDRFRNSCGRGCNRARKYFPPLSSGKFQRPHIRPDRRCDRGSRPPRRVFGAGDHRRADSAFHDARRAGQSLRADV